MSCSILAAGTIACGEVIDITCQKRGELALRFPCFFAPAVSGNQELKFLKSMDMEKLEEEVCELCRKYSADAVFRMGEGGIFRALWDLGIRLGCGLTVDLKKIPICQETIEICEYADINPYEADSRGAVLIACRDAGPLLMALKERGIRAELIGSMNGSKAKTLLYDGHVRYLDKPRRLKKPAFISS